MCLFDVDIIGSRFMRIEETPTKLTLVNLYRLAFIRLVIFDCFWYLSWNLTPLLPLLKESGAVVCQDVREEGQAAGSHVYTQQGSDQRSSCLTQ